MKFHINNNGEVTRCTAQEGNCKFGGKHFNDANKAFEYLDQINELAQEQKVDFELIRKEIEQIDLFNYKKSNKLEYTMEEALERGKFVQNKLDSVQHLNSDRLYKNKDGSWKEDRAKLHNRLLREVLLKYEKIPSDKKVIFSAGVPGAGKTTILNKNYNINEYAIVSSDDFKELLAREKAIPTVPGLTQMEASTLVHEESSYLADRLLKNLGNQGKNIIYDFTCKNRSSLITRLTTLEQLFNYKRKNMDILFVNVPLSISKERAKLRYLNGLNSDKGGRFLPEEVIDQSKPTKKKFDSINAENLIDLAEDEELNLNKPRIFDNTFEPKEIDYQEFKKGYNS